MAVPWWGVLSAAGAPALLIGGWTVAARLQPEGYDPVVETISALAGYGASARWVMGLALIGVGLCHLLTALALRPAAPTGRAVLAAGGLGTLLVAATPLPQIGGSPTHTAAAALAFGALAAWPALAWRRTAAAWPLRPAPALVAAAVLLGLVGWFTGELYGGGQRVGAAERVAAGAQALWPLAVVLAARRAR